MLSIQNASLRLEIDLERNHLNFIPLESRFPILRGVQLGISLQVKGKSFNTLQIIISRNQEHGEIIDTREHGRIEIIQIPVSIQGINLQALLTLGITHEYPLILWKLKFVNHESNPLMVRRIHMLLVDPKYLGETVYPAAKGLAEKGFYSHGWQSWSMTASYQANERMQRSRLHQLQTPMIYYAGTPIPRKEGEFSSDMFAVVGDRTARTGFLVGFLSQKEQFGSIHLDFTKERLEMWANGDDATLNPGASMETDWAVFTPILLDHRAPLEQYLEAVGRENQARNRVEIPPGWCSWYHFYTGVTAENVVDNLEKIVDEQERLPLQLVQIDDGFETQVGDWSSFKSTFPEGVAGLAEKIKKEGMIPGLWLAPFAVHPRSELIRKHPDWILRTAAGLPVNAGFGWNAHFTGLDLTNPEALAYACHVVRTASQKWGYPYLKLDFLYAAALPGRYKDSTKTRAQVLRMGMNALRDAMGESTLMLGCGLPLGSGIGIVDAMRISADVSGDWYPSIYGVKKPFRNEPAVPCARNSVRNTITRAWQHRAWWTNDPDCLLVRPDSNLTLAEVQSMATVIGMTGGMLLLSDDLTQVPEERLRIAAQLIPAVAESLRVMDWFDERMPAKLRLDMLGESGSWQLLSWSNWSDEERPLTLVLKDYQLEEGEYLYREFWSGKIGRVNSASPEIFGMVPPHGSILLALRKVVGSTPLYLGSDLHFSQGNEVSEWREDGEEMSIGLRLPRNVDGKIYLYIPIKINTIQVDGLAVEPVQESEHIYSIPVNVQGYCNIKIKKESSD